MLIHQAQALPFDGAEPEPRGGRFMIRWTRSQAWNDRHRCALVFGGLLACMVGGFVIFAVGGALAIDWIGKAILNVIAVLAMVKLGRRLCGEQLGT